MLLVVLAAGLVLSSVEALFLDDASGVVKRTRVDEALLSRSSLNVENEAVRWELLATLHSEDVSWLDFGPID